MYSTDCTDSNVLRTKPNVILPRRAKNKRVLIFEVCVWARSCIGPTTTGTLGECGPIDVLVASNNPAGEPVAQTCGRIGLGRMLGVVLSWPPGRAACN